MLFININVSWISPTRFILLVTVSHALSLITRLLHLMKQNSVWNHQPRDCLLNHLFRRRSKKTSKLRVTGLCVGNSPGTGEFPAQMARYAENVSIWWRHHDQFDYFMWHVICCSCVTFNDGLVIPLPKIGCRWIITYHCFCGYSVEIHWDGSQ